MNNKGMSHAVGLATQQDGYLSWQDPETGEWMVLTPLGSPFAEGKRIEAHAPVAKRVLEGPRQTCSHCA
ncbi:MAG: hypothetical protein JKY61_09140, partial [Planctomycetes bacterium]|nr:hypothetical protein [Planctomycetota bacterium]